MAFVSFIRKISKCGIIFVTHVPMKRICFYINAQKQGAKDIRNSLAAEAAALGLAVVGPAEAEAVVVLGGDGTILKAVHEFPGVPVLGLNFGGLGYLSSVGREDFPKALGMLAAGEYRIAERTTLAVRKVGTEGPWYVALNDVVVDRVMSGHAAIMDLEIDGAAATRYLADGLILATPTGSTAYSLAAGGPVLMPDSGSFVVTPMSPHALGVRPLVVKDSARFVLTSRRRTNGEAERLGVYADGENVFMLDADEAMEAVRAERGARLIELAGYDPYVVLARKLGWSGTSSGYAKN